MNNHQAKEILSAYRADGSDAQDEIFAEALEQCRKDPELQAWFVDQIKFDSIIGERLREIRGPEDGKQAILAFSNFGEKESKKFRWSKLSALVSLGIAATFLIVATLFYSLSTQTFDRIDVDNFSVAQLVSDGVPLDHHSKSRLDITNWLEDHSAPVPPTLPDIFKLANAEGCSIFSDGRGGMISLFCFEMDGELVHVLTFDTRTRKYFKRPEGQWWSDGDLNMIAFESEDDLFAIATRLPAETLGKYL